jgi:tryptophan synthase beta chain
VLQHQREIPAGSQVVVCLSGRGDKDLDIIEAYEKKRQGVAS